MNICQIKIKSIAELKRRHYEKTYISNYQSITNEH